MPDQSVSAESTSTDLGRPASSRILWVLCGLGLLVVFIALVGGLFSQIREADSQNDVTRHQLLASTLAEYRALRRRAASDMEWEAFSEKALSRARTIAREVEPFAGRLNPAKQYMLWNTRHRLPEMLSQRGKPIVYAEYEFEQNLYEIAKLLQIPMERPQAPPPLSQQSD